MYSNSNIYRTHHQIQLSSPEDLVKMFPKIEKTVVIDYCKKFGLVAAYDYLLDIQLISIRIHMSNAKIGETNLNTTRIPRKRKYDETW